MSDAPDPRVVQMFANEVANKTSQQLMNMDQINTVAAVFEDMCTVVLQMATKWWFGTFSKLSTILFIANITVMSIMLGKYSYDSYKIYKKVYGYEHVNKDAADLAMQRHNFFWGTDGVYDFISTNTRKLTTIVVIQFATMILGYIARNVCKFAVQKARTKATGAIGRGATDRLFDTVNQTNLPSGVADASSVGSVIPS